MQSWPRPCVIIKLTVSGVTFSAAQTKSPSFSRSSASTTMMVLPAAIAATASSMLEYGVDMWDHFSGHVEVGSSRPAYH